MSHMDGEQDATQTEGQQQERRGNASQPQGGAKTPRRTSRKR